MREYYRMAVECRLEALNVRCLRATRALRAGDEPSSKRVSGVRISGKPLKLRSWRCTREPPKLQQA